MTFDIYTNRIPCNLLKPLEIAQFKAHNGGFEFFTDKGGWYSAPCPSWCSRRVYRAVRPTLTKPSINWDHVADKWKWLTRDKNGEAFISDQMPITGKLINMWACVGDLFRIDEILSSYTPGTCDWKDSLVMRPEAGQ